MKKRFPVFIKGVLKFCVANGIKLSFKTFLICLIVSCQGSLTQEAKFEKEIKGLKSIELQKEFLEEIRRLDRKVRRHETLQLEEFGYDSEEHKQAINEMVEADNLNLLKIETYLKLRGHPTIEKHGALIAGTPWIVIHHATGGVEPRSRNFEFIYSAFKNGDVKGNELSFYLNRMHNIKHGSRIRWDKPFKLEDELDTLFKSLELLEVVARVDSLNVQ